MKNYLNKSQAIKKMLECGVTLKDAETMIQEVSAENCEPTNNVLDEDDLTEWMASVYNKHAEVILQIYYLTTEEDEDEVDNNGGDWGNVDWENRVAGYMVFNF